MAKFDQGGGCPCGLYRECEPRCEHAPRETSVEYMERMRQLQLGVDKVRAIQREDKLWVAHKMRDDLERAESQLRKAYEEYLRCKEKINKS